LPVGRGVVGRAVKVRPAAAAGCGLGGAAVSAVAEDSGLSSELLNSFHFHFGRGGKHPYQPVTCVAKRYKKSSPTKSVKTGDTDASAPTVLL